MPVAEVRVLGPVEVIGEDGRIPLVAKHARLLAALVVADGRACGVDEIVEAMWDGAVPASGRKLVQVYVSQLRKALPAEIAIETRQSAYALAVTDGALDSGRFERLLGESRAARAAGNPALALSLADRALALWRGRAFGELAYEEFARSESERLDELRLVALEERLAAQLELGRHAEVLGEACAHADEYALRERGHELAMLALYRSGRQADALEHYADYRTRLDEELGLEPGPALRDLQLRILQQDSSLAVDANMHAASALPVPPNPLVGREHEVEALCALLERGDSRLIVLTGAGGSGKTRLALEVARQVAGSYANGVVLVELAPLRDPALVLPTIAQTLEVGIDVDEDVLEALAGALGSQELLLVLDNAEHVRASAAAYAELVARAGRLTLLITSRAVLHVSGEHVFPVAPLDEQAAVELFSQRACRLDPGFVLGPDNESDVREICQRVDGLPLAIELAAARIRSLTPRALLERLDARLGILTGGPRDLPTRQQTLRETIDWSVGLLDERSREAFARLAVFPGGASLSAAEGVCGADVDTLANLVDQNLVQRLDEQGEPRFGMLETVREYALELLADEREDVELSLVEYCALLADELRLAAPVEHEWRRLVESFDPEIDNFRAALNIAASSHDNELLMRLASGLWNYWLLRGPASEGLAWIERALAADDRPATAARACALQGGAGLAWMRGDNARARELAEAAIPIAMETGSKWDEQAAHTLLGLVEQAEEGDLALARRHHQRSVELMEELGREPLTQKLNLGTVALEAGAYEEAITLFEYALDGHRKNGSLWGMGFAHLDIGVTCYELGDTMRSRREFEAARALFERVGHAERLAHALQGLAATDALDLRHEEAARRLGRARRMLDDYGAPEDRLWPRMIAATKERARDALGAEAFEAAYGAGREDAG